MYNSYFYITFAVLSAVATYGIETSLDKFYCQKGSAAASGCKA